MFTETEQVECDCGNFNEIAQDERSVLCDECGENCYHDDEDQMFGCEDEDD